jgi:hypothetical protein
MRALNATGRLAALAAFLVTAGLWQAAGAAEDTKITAFSVWQAQGMTYPTGVQQGTFLGTFTGTVYVLSDQGPQLSGDLVCPAVITFDHADKGQAGRARCTITSRDGSAVFGELSCTGFQLVGCDGDYKITGGTGRFAGITGGGHVSVRSESRSTGATVDANGGVSEQARGIIYWRELEYKIP